ncbi:MAG: prolyl oligopeptidase family serine peptidase [Thermoanaerobaculia bacterium]|nr:prolyl oligopeptidase family serine peptidase [Thermoanaerobaculia bacterium]
MHLKFFCLGLLLLGSVPALADEPMVPVPDAITTREVPPIPAHTTRDLVPYENIRNAGFTDWHPSERRMLIGTRFSETNQVHEVGAPMGARTQLTFGKEPANGGIYRPGKPHEVLYVINEGGAENFQFWLLDRNTGKSRRLSDGKHRYSSPTYSPDGKLLAYVHNGRNERDFDVYVMNPDDPASERRVVELEGSWAITDWSADGKWLAVTQYVSAASSHPHTLELGSGKLERLVTLPAGELAAYAGGLFSADGKSLFYATDRGSEFRRLVRLDLATRAWTVLSGGIEWDVDSFDVSDDGRRLAFLTNEDGISRLRALDLSTGKEVPTPELPAAVMNGPVFRPSSHEVALDVSWARSPSDIYTVDLAGGPAQRWTASEVGGLPTEQFSIPQLVRFPSFDGLSIPAFVYRPNPARHQPPFPVYINIHGGPEGQSRPNFQGSSNYWIDELGIALIYPNVRGSSGYGKTYLALDNAEKREDSVKDIGALLDWIATQPDLDKTRVMVGGGSYGGYMSLASMVFYSDRLRAGFDYVGISNFVTFLENTQGYRRDLRRVEYGDERDPKMRAKLEEISPLRRVDQIRVPVLVAQGANDPRVPVTEAEQVVAAIAAHGKPVWYVVAADEGHGFQKKSNADYLRVVLTEFMRRHLLGR